MKPQTHSASSPRRAPAPPPRSRATPRTDRDEDLDLDFYTLRQNRIATEKPPLQLVPTELETEANPFGPVDPETEQFKRLVRAKPERAKPERAVRKRAAKAPCAPCHWGLLVSAMLLTALSIPLVYSASTALALDQHGGNPDFFLFRQIGFALVGFLVMISASRIAPSKLRGFAWLLYGLAVAGLVATKWSPLGASMGNTERWVRLGPITLQFSELAKIALVGVMADFWSRAARDSQKSMLPWVFAAILAGIPLVLTLVQPHLSAALILFVVPVAIAFYAGAPRKHFGVLFALLATLGLFTVVMCKTGAMPGMKPYQQQRIAAHFGGNSKDESRTSDYQKLQGERAIIRGGVRGVGMGASLYKHTYMPAAHTDFIFAVIGEELGMLGTLGVLALYGAITFFCFQTGHGASNSFNALLCAGVGTLIGVQAAGNIGVVSGLLPVTGMPLPILTYGGSGLMCALLGIGLVLSVSRAQCDGE